MADVDWENFHRETLEHLVKIQTDSNIIRLQPLTDIEKGLCDNIEMAVEATKEVLNFAKNIGFVLRRVDTELASARTQIGVLCNAVGDIKTRLDKLEKK